MSVLVNDRQPWSMELFRHDGTALRSVGTVTPASSTALASEILPLSFRLTTAGQNERPQIEAVQTETGGRWLL